MIVSTVSQALLWAVLGLGIFVTFRILNFPDMTTEGSFPLGGAVAVTLLTQGVHPVFGNFGGCFGRVHGGISYGLVIYQEGKIPTLLAGILVMSSCHSVILFIMGRANLGLLNTNRLQDLLPFSDQLPS